MKTTTTAPAKGAEPKVYLGRRCRVNVGYQACYGYLMTVNGRAIGYVYPVRMGKPYAKEVWRMHTVGEVHPEYERLCEGADYSCPQAWIQRVKDAAKLLATHDPKCLGAPMVPAPHKPNFEVANLQLKKLKSGCYKIYCSGVRGHFDGLLCGKVERNGNWWAFTPAKDFPSAPEAFRSLKEVKATLPHLMQAYCSGELQSLSQHAAETMRGAA